MTASSLPPRWRAALGAGAVVAAALMSGFPLSVPAAETGGTRLCAMTFNLRYASPTPPHAWPERRPVLRALIESVAPDLIGTQEGLYPQLKDLEVDLPAYRWIGLGRDGGSRGEFMAVFYRPDRFEPLEYDHFWLSDTPNVIASATWGHANRRMVTWVRFRERASGQAFYFWNTHLDHQVQPAREKAAQLIQQRVSALGTDLPLLLVGDFNASAGRNPAYDILVRDGGFADTWTTAAERRGEQVKTFHSFRGPVPGDDRIDWILARGPVRAEAVEIITFNRQGQYPSDHFPVVAWLHLGARSAP
jgi:endonuclease/exonuclease/phosphatase family metal-dependent hydrolase